jgi:putative ABC transport system permease protein
MTFIPLDPLDLVFAAALIIILAGLSATLRLGLTRSILIAAARTTIQLFLIGLILKVLFARATLGWVAAMGAVMLAVAGFEVAQRQRRRLSGAWGYGIGTLSMFLSAVAVTVFALAVVIGPEPWHAPQYSIPLLGMMFGNSMNGVALSVDHLTSALAEKRAQIEGRLMLGATRAEAIAGPRRDAMRVGMIPIVNAMAAAGVVSLPGMMTGQILAGSPPEEAVKYQILIMFMVAAITGMGAMLAVELTARRLFDPRQRLRLDRLGAKREAR